MSTIPILCPELYPEVRPKGNRHCIVETYIMNWYKLAQDVTTRPTSSMNLKINPDAVKRAFKALEGANMDDSHGWDEWVSHLATEAEYGDNMPDWMKEDMEGAVASIYGRGGWHRYHIMGNGDVVFSKSHADRDGVRDAVAAGFQSW